MPDSTIPSIPPFRRPWWPLFVLVAAAGSVVGFFLLRTITAPPAPSSTPPAPAARPVASQAAVEVAYVGGDRCVSCHPTEADAWKGSDHQQAMEVADEKTVLGDFADATFTQFGVTSRFFRRGGQFMVNTDGADGALADFVIRYTFGVRPLQQYLIELPGGRLQALDIAWDSRPAEAGGQRWFHLHPEDPVRRGDVLHWTGPALNWNFMCADCHSTNLRKNYQAAEDRFDSTWTDINVSCEACHGPGSGHLAWAARQTDGGTPDPDPAMGLLVSMRRGPWPWVFDPDQPTARRTHPLESRAEAETCARCHGRVDVIAATYVHGQPLADSRRLALLEETLYFADGQQLDEVYEYGSFLQSKMHAKGVTCSDCHEPHGARRVDPPDSLCAQCHKPSVFATPEHHHHKSDSAGASCVACHMPSRNYMVIDGRRDHSIRVPRPDLTLSIGTPNACADCHADKSAEWAATEVAAWRGPSKPVPPHFGEALHAGRVAALDAESRLRALALDQTQPAIARATALTLLPPFVTTSSLPAIEAAAKDPDPLVRGAAARVAASVPASTAQVWSLLGDPVKSVRLEAAIALLFSAGESVAPENADRLTKALVEYRDTQLINEDRAESLTNLGSLAAQLGDQEEAERRFLQALRVNPSFIPARIYAAEMFRQAGDERKGEAILRDGLRLVPDAAALHHALGLVLVRLGRRDEALVELQRAAEAAPEDVSMAYAYGVALNSVGRADEALAQLEAAHARRPAFRELLVALATMNRDAGHRDAALRHARTLQTLVPDDATVDAFVAELESEK